MRRHTVHVECTLLQWLKTHADAAALADGRVFLEQPGKKPTRMRELDAQRVLQTGWQVRIADAHASAVSPLRLIEQRAGYLVADKPAGIPTIPDQRGAAQSLLAHVASYLKLPIERVHPTSRLDREVSGIVVFALDARTRTLLADAREHGEYERTYLALSTGAAPPQKNGIWDAPIGRGRTPTTRAVGGPDPAKALTHYRYLASAAQLHAWALYPQTGRTHQLRVHAAHAGAPLLGDSVYGGLARLGLPNGRMLAPGRVLLHAHRVRALGHEWLSPRPALFDELWAAAAGAEYPSDF